MRETDIEKIIKQSPIKQRIKLYFTDIAYFNTTGINSAKIVRSGNDAKIEVPDIILTDKEKALIYKSIKDPEDLKYWEELRTWNKAFLLYRPKIEAYTSNFKYLTATLSKYVTIEHLHKVYEITLNDMLETVEAENIREKLRIKAQESLKPFNIITHQPEGENPLNGLKIASMEFSVKMWAEVLNEKIIEAKKHIQEIRSFLKTNLPLVPYLQLIKKEEEKIKAEVKECKELLESCYFDETECNILKWDDPEEKLINEELDNITKVSLC